MSVIRRRRRANVDEQPTPEVETTPAPSETETDPESPGARGEREPLTLEEVEELKDLAQRALLAMISLNPVSITRRKGEPNNGLPLPIKRQDPDSKGNTTQNYRAIAVLEYVNDRLQANYALLQRLDKQRGEKP